MRSTRNWALALCILTMAACGDDNETAPSAVSFLVGSWELIAIERDDGSVATIDDPASYTATFADDGDLSVRADCNQCNGSYRLEGTMLEISPLACTRAFCGPDSFFDEYTMALTAATTFSRSGDELRIDYDGGTLVFRAA